MLFYANLKIVKVEQLWLAAYVATRDSKWIVSRTIKLAEGCYKFFYE